MPENRRILSVVVLLAIAVMVPTAAAADSTPPPAAPFGGAGEAAIVRAMNSARAAHGLPRLRVGPALRRAARSHSNDMVRRSYFEHGPFVRRLRHFGVRSPLIGENLAYGTELTAADVVQMWLQSPGHRENMLDPRFRLIGVGVAGGVERLVTADFAGR